MEERKIVSYTAASSIPLKIILDDELLKSITKNKKILPIHIQLNFENKCTRNCEWCSCVNRDKRIEMNYENVMNTMNKFKGLGAKCVTITGGGEPILHPKFNDLIKSIYDLGFSIGLVSNGDLIKNINEESIKRITWLRISLGDKRKLNSNYWKNLSEFRKKAKNIDMSFSYVINNNFPDFYLITEMVNFANENNFIHIRLVNNILEAEKLTDGIENVKKYLRGNSIDDSLVIYQNRGEWALGVKNCWISLLKPIVTADGKLGACCGEQYRTAPPTKDYVGDWGIVEDIEDIWKNQKCYDGRKCVKCYYNNYNFLLSTLLENVQHKEFV